MPWSKKDVPGHTKKATTDKAKRLTNSAVDRCASEGSAIRQANAVVKKRKKK